MNERLPQGTFFAIMLVASLAYVYVWSLVGAKVLLSAALAVATFIVMIAMIFT